MKWLNNLRILLLFEFVGSFSFGTVLIHAESSECEGIRPIADSGRPRYVTTEPVQLDGSKSYDPYRVMDYDIISDTPNPPNDVITTLPFEETWWTVRIRDQYGSSIYADPRRIDTHILSLPVENLTTGERYGYIQDAVDDGVSGDEIVIAEGIYRENVDFQGKNLIVRSADPNDSSVVATTILTGDGKNNLVTFSNNESAGCVLAGLTITDANNGVFCSVVSPTVANCRIVANSTAGLKLGMGSSPTIANSIIARNSGPGIAMFIFKSVRTPFVDSPTISHSHSLIGDVH
jgi:hypothetical protein